MIFEDLLIRGFGNLSNVKFEFGQGLNVFVAPNEAGKSTLAECLFRCLYGFPPLRSDEERAAYKRFQPLNGDRYSAKLRIATDEQTHYELDRDFAARTLRIRNAVTGEDVTGQFPVEKKGQDVLLAQNLLGISRDTFRTIAFLAQGLVDRLENGQELSDEIRKIADSGEFQTGYKKALEKLKKASDTIGKGERASSKPLWEAQERVNTLQREREEICAKRKERITALERIEILKHQLAEADRACLELEVRGLALQQARVRATIGQLETLGREIDQARAIAQQLDGYRNVPCHRRDELFVNADRLKGVQQRLAQYQSQLASLDAELSAINDRLSETEHLAKLSEKDIEQMDVLENALKRAETELDLLEGKISQSRLTQKRLEDQINALSQRLKGFTGELGKDPLAFEQQLARYDQASSLEREVALRREQVSKTQARIAGKKGGFRWIALGAGLFLFIIVAALKAAPGGEFVPAIIWGVTAGVAGFLFSNLGFRLVMKGDAEQLILEQETLRTAEVELAKVEKERQQQLSNASVSNLKELRELFQLYRSHQSELENHQTLLQHLLNESGRHEQELTSAQSQIQDYLMQCKIVAKDEPFQDKSLLRLRQQYLARKENCQKRDNLKAKQRELTQQISETQTEMETLNKKVAAVLLEAKVETPEQFNEVCAEKDRLVHIEQQIENLEQQRQLLVGETSEAGLAEEERQIVSRLLVLDAKPAPCAPDPKALQTVGQDLSRQKERIQSLRAEVAHEEGQQKAFSDSVRSLADVDEQLELANADLNRLRDYQDAVLLAMKVIDESARDFHERVFAPEMGRLCADLVSKVTAGRYKEIQLEKELTAIHVIGSNDESLDGSWLSRGTIEQVYFALRVAIGTFLTQGRERIPLVLDDTFANTDDQRLDLIAQLLLRLSEQTQVILFTCHPFQYDRILQTTAETPQQWKTNQLGDFTVSWL